MISINCYFTLSELLPKTFCSLAEKCYYNGTKTCVISQNKDQLNSLDKSLWTYSKKHFIPHGTQDDPFKNQHPIYLTTEIDKNSDTKIYIIINPSEEFLLSTLSALSKIDIEKLLLVIDVSIGIPIDQLKSLLSKSNLGDNPINFFDQSKNGNWTKID